MGKISLFFLAITLAATGCKDKNYKELGDGIFAEIQTTKGDIIVKLHYDKTPVTVANFVSLAEGTNTFVTDSLKKKKYYDGIVFHRVIKDFMIQAGDPTGTGRFGPGYKFEDELSDSLRHNKKGILSMANAGINTNGSQFFITHKETPALDGYDQNGNLKNCQNPRVGCHTVFGEVVKGLEVVDSIANVETSKDPQTKDRPIKDVVITHVEIIKNGSNARKFDANQVMADYFEEIDEMERKRKKVVEDLLKEFETQKAEATETASGLKYIFLNRNEEAEKPKEGQTVMVNYSVHLASTGELFETSVLEVAQKYGKVNKQKQAGNGYVPVPMQVSKDAQLIHGFKEGLFLLNTGDKARLFVPSHLGYGPTGAGGVIPPNADLVFDLEIVEVVE